jgi:transcriptional regulator with XRE-family HTH domain
MKRGLSQTDLGKLVGVTPSTISQVESNLIYPSLPALFKMSEVLSVPVNYFFPASTEQKAQVVFSGKEAATLQPPGFPKDHIRSKLLTPVDFQAETECYRIEIPRGTKLHSHFFVHKGEEIGYLISGTLTMTMGHTEYVITPGDLVYLTSDVPNQWENTENEIAQLLWIKIK